MLLAVNILLTTSHDSLQAASVSASAHGFKLRRLRMRLPVDDSPHMPPSQPVTHATSHLPSVSNSEPSLVNYALQHCLPLRPTYTQLISHNLAAYNSQLQHALDNKHASPSALYVIDDHVFVDQVADRHALQPLFAMLQHLKLKVSLPNLWLPANFSIAADPTHSTAADPAAPANHQQAGSLFPDFQLLIQNDSSNSINTSDVVEQLTTATPWAVTTDAQHHNSIELPRAGLAHAPAPEGSITSNPNQIFNQPLQESSMQKSMRRTQPDTVQLVALASTNSDKLAEQLASTALPFIAGSSQPLWCTHMLKPFIHFVPVKINSSYDNLSDMLAWAAQHKYAASCISEQARAFADLYLSPTGRECYALQMLFRLTKRGFDTFDVPASAEDISACHELDSCAVLHAH